MAERVLEQRLRKTRTEIEEKEILWSNGNSKCTKNCSSEVIAHSFSW